MTEAEVRAIVHQEIASLAGLALRRLQDENFTRSIEGNIAAMKAKDVIGHFWGEVLSEYGNKQWPVPEPDVLAETSGIAADYADSAE